MNQVAGIDINELRFRLIMLFALLIPISAFLSLRVAIVISILSLIINYRKIGTGIIKSWEIMIFIFILFIGLVYTDDLRTGFRVLETSASLLIVPIIFLHFKGLSKSKLHKIVGAFTLGLMVACIICLWNAFLKYLDTGNVNHFFYYNFTTIIKAHPTYIAYYLIFSITWELHLLFFKPVPFNQPLASVIVLFLFAMLLLTGGQTAFISLLLIFSFFILKFIMEEKSTNRKIIFTLVCIMLVFMFVFNPNDQNEILNDSWDRFKLWIAAIHATSNPFFGEGTGDYKIVLNQYYQTHQMARFADESLNSHNQFIQIYFSNGILGLISLIILLGRPLYRSFRSGNSLGILIFFPFLIYGMTEVFLGRYQGVVFFALLHQIFLSYFDPTEDKFDLNIAPLINT